MDARTSNNSLSRSGKSHHKNHTRSRTRKKPTLNCSECVARKIRCDRARPQCRSCIRRQAICSYSQIADILVALGPETPPESRRRRTSQRASVLSDNSSIDGVGEEAGFAPSSFLTDTQSPSSVQQRAAERLRTSRTATLKVYNEISEHPFLNYWTMTGGIAEVLPCLPSKEEATLFIDLYFDTIDPLYPILPRLEYEMAHEQFWSLTYDQKLEYDNSQLALYFAVYAIGAQFVDHQSLDERTRLSNFYLSASYQALCLYSFFSRCSVASIQCMVIICYYLINKSRLSDAWTFSGIAQRQAYGLELNSSQPSMWASLSEEETQTRRKLWQAVVVQDSTLSLYLQLAPTTMHSDLSPASLSSSLSEIALVGMQLPDTVLEHDTQYMRAMWEYAIFLQKHICVRRSLNRPICASSSEKSHVISQFLSMFRNWEPPFNSTDKRRFATSIPRLARQLIAMTSNYFSALAILYLDEDETAGVSTSVYDALDAAQEALSAFFALVRLFPAEVTIWDGPHTRAYAQATIIGEILSSHINTPPENDKRTQLLLAKSTFDRYVDTLNLAHGTGDYAKIRETRLAALQILAERINID